MAFSRKQISIWFPLVLLAILGFGLVWYCTVWGAGLISDSFQYLASARNLAAGNSLGYPDENGAFIPLTQYPPLFPVILAVFEKLNVDGMIAARVINASLFTFNIVLVGISVYKISSSKGFSLLGSFLMALSPIMIETHAWFLSEPLFIFLNLLAFYWLAVYSSTGNKRWMIASALAGSLSLVTRYVGLAFLPVALVLIAWKCNDARKPRWIDMAWYTLIYLLPMALWTVRNYLVSGTFNNRSIQWVPLTSKNIISLLNTVATWFVPKHVVDGREKWAFIFLLILGGVIGLFFLWGRKKQSILLFRKRVLEQPLFLTHGLYLPFYVGMIVFSKMFFDNNIGMSDRMFSPLVVSLIVMGSASLAGLWQNEHTLLKISTLVVASYFIVYFGFHSASLVSKYHRQGIGLARKNWHSSQVIQSINNYAAYPIYSNSPSTLYLWSGQTGGGILSLDQMIKNGFSEDAILVVFYHIPVNNRLNRLMENMELLESDSIAQIYLYSP